MIKVIGYFLVVIGIFLGVVSVSDILAPATPGGGRIGAVAVFVAGAIPMVLLGVYLISRSKSNSRRKLDDVLIGEPIRQRIWDLANARGGQLTSAQLAQDMGLRPERAERELRRLSSHGHAELRINPAGGTYYLFTLPVDPDEWELNLTDA